MDHYTYTGEGTCTFTGDDFACAVTQDPTGDQYTFEGSRTGATSASGTHTFDIGSCAGTGTFTAMLQ
jgi:hypothetical protein